MTDIDLLESVLSKTADLIEGVDGAHLNRPTPCSEYDVKALRSHIVGWSQVFAAGSAARPFAGDPKTYVAGDDAVQVFRAAAAEMVQGWREHGIDREITLHVGTNPAGMVFNMMLMEYFTHGWDLATAPGQAVPFTEDEAAEVLQRAEATRPDAYRGDAFGPPVAIAPDAPAVERMIAFMGRRTP